MSCGLATVGLKAVHHSAPRGALPAGDIGHAFPSVASTFHARRLLLLLLLAPLGGLPRRGLRAVHLLLLLVLLSRGLLPLLGRRPPALTCHAAELGRESWVPACAPGETSPLALEVVGRSGCVDDDVRWQGTWVWSAVGVWALRMVFRMHANVLWQCRQQRCGSDDAPHSAHTQHVHGVSHTFRPVACCTCWVAVKQLGVDLPHFWPAVAHAHSSSSPLRLLCYFASVHDPSGGCPTRPTRPLGIAELSTGRAARVAAHNSARSSAAWPPELRLPAPAPTASESRWWRGPTVQRCSRWR